MNQHKKARGKNEPPQVSPQGDNDDLDASHDDEGEVEVIYPHGQSTSGAYIRGRSLRDQPPPDEEELRPSKTKIKKQMHALRDLGKELTELGKDQLAQLDLPENLRDAIAEMKSINKFGAQRRQLQYVGKLMRDVDPAPIIAKLDAWKGKSQHHTAHLHLLERWRDRLLESDGALTELLAAHPEADAQRLRTLIRNAQKEAAMQKPPKSYRELFQALKEIIPEIE